MKNVFINSFGGIMPKVSPKLLQANLAQVAENCTLESGRIVPLKEPKNESGAASGRTIYKWRKSGGGTSWLKWDGDVNVVAGLVADDEYSRIYYTGDGVPKVKGDISGAETTRNMKFDKPGAPTISKIEPVFPVATVQAIICRQYFYIYKMKEVEYADGTKGFEKDTLQYELEHDLTLSSYSYEEDGLILEYTGYSGLLASIGSNGYWGVFGCRYRLSVPSFEVNEAFTLPTSGNVDYSSPKFSSERKELLDSDSKKFAEMQIVSLEDTDINSFFKVDGTAVSSIAIGNSIKFRVAMNYTDGGTTKHIYYLQTKINDWGIESIPSDHSTQVVLKPGHRVTLENIGGAEGQPARIYRSAAGSVETAFFYVDDCAEETYLDKKPDSELGEQLDIYENIDDNLRGLVAMPGGFLAGFKKDTKEIHFSAPYLPHCWKTEWRITIDSDIVGLGVSGNDLIVLTKDFPYLIAGDHPDSMSVIKLPFEQSCVSKRSICNFGNTVCYASPDGFCRIVGGRGEIITETAFGKDDWRAFLPQNEDDFDDVVAGVYDNKIHVFSRNKGIIIDAISRNITETDQKVTALYKDNFKDVLYVVIDNKVKRWDDPASTKNLKVRWKTKEFQFLRPINFAVTRIIADEYPTEESDKLKLLIYAEGTLVLTLDVLNDKDFKIPDVFPEKQWSFELQSYHAIDELVVSTSILGVRGADA